MGDIFLPVKTWQGYVLVSSDLLPLSSEETMRIYPDRELAHGSTLGTTSALQSPEVTSPLPREGFLLQKHTTQEEPTLPSSTAFSSTSGSILQSEPDTSTEKVSQLPFANAGFDLTGYRILPYNYEYPNGKLPPDPDNKIEILQALSQRRRSLSPTRFSADDFRVFRRHATPVSTEGHHFASGLPMICGADEDSTCAAGGTPVTDNGPSVDGTTSFGDYCVSDRACPEQFDRDSRRIVTGRSLSHTQNDISMLPNFFVQAPELGGRWSAAMQQASYNGASGARDVHRLQSYGQLEPRYDNNAYTMTSIYHEGKLEMYTSHPVPPSELGGEPGIAMTKLQSWDLRSSAEAFRQGATAYRNGRDWARQQRDRAISQAKAGAT